MVRIPLANRPSRWRDNTVQRLAELRRRDNRSAAAWLGGWLLIGGGLITLATAELPGQPDVNRTALAVVGALACSAGGLALILPWTRWRPAATLVLALLGFGLVSGSAIVGGIRPYSYGIYFALIFVWAGLSHPLRFVYLLIPPAALAYLAPMLIGAVHQLDATVSVAVVIPVCVLIGHSLGASAARERRARAELAGQVHRAEEQARQDPLTGLYNRRALYLEAPDRLQKARHGGGASVVICDVDRLKHVNDRAGHAAGDELLNAAAQILRSSTRADDLVARIGGDEFCLLVNEPEWHRLHLRLEGALAEVNFQRADAGLEPISFSCGGATTAEAGFDLDTLMAVADQRMYSEKALRSAGPLNRRATTPARHDAGALN